MYILLSITYIVFILTFHTKKHYLAQALLSTLDDHHDRKFNEIIFLFKTIAAM